jgi:hypothetical protein
MEEQKRLKVVPIRTPDPDLTVDACLHHAIGQNLKGVVVLGLCRDGSAHIDASSMEGPEVIWLLELAKAKAMAFWAKKMGAE